MNRTQARSVRSATTILLGVLVAAGLMTRDAHAQAMGPDPDAHVALSLRAAGVAVGAALAANLFAAHLWLELGADEAPPPRPPFPPLPPCCYVPPPPPVVMVAPMPLAPPSHPMQLGLAVSGLVQSPSSAPGQSPIAGVAAALQVRTSARSILGLEVQSLTSDRTTTTHSRRDELAGLMAGRLFPWDAPFAPYVELAGGLGRASIDTNALVVDVSQLIGRAGIGIELRLGPHLVLDGQLAQVHRFNLDHQSRDLAASDPAFVGEHERLTELRCGLGYRF